MSRLVATTLGIVGCIDSIGGTSTDPALAQCNFAAHHFAKIRLHSGRARSTPKQVPLEPLLLVTLYAFHGWDLQR